MELVKKSLRWCGTHGDILCFFDTIPDGAAACYKGAAACNNGAAACYMVDEMKIKLTQPS